jgi:hypothetical protein
LGGKRPVHWIGFEPLLAAEQNSLEPEREAVLRGGVLATLGANSWLAGGWILLSRRGFRKFRAQSRINARAVRRKSRNLLSERDSAARKTRWVYARVVKVLDDKLSKSGV